MNIVDRLLGMTLFGAEWVLWLLIALSILSLAVIIERFFFFQKIKMNFPAYLQRLTALLVENDTKGIKNLCDDHPGPSSECLQRGIQYTDKGPNAMEESMSAYLASERQHLDRGLTFLGTLGNNAPFIGLLGTVIGIIQAFHDLSANPAGGPQIVMGGISEALVATAVGLFVAIPAVIAFNTYNRLVKRHYNQAEAVKKLLLSHYSR